MQTVWRQLGQRGLPMFNHTRTGVLSFCLSPPCLKRRNSKYSRRGAAQIGSRCLPVVSASSRRSQISFQSHPSHHNHTVGSTEPSINGAFVKSMALNSLLHSSLKAALGAGMIGAALLTSDVARAEETMEIPPDVGGVFGSNLIAVMFVVASIGLSVLTIGVVYLSVVDYMEKKEQKKMNDAAEEERKQSRQKQELSSRPGPKGFGKKFVKEQ